MSIGTTLELYKTMSAEDKAALQEIRSDLAKRSGKQVSLAEAIASIEPGMNTPAFLVGM